MKMKFILLKKLILDIFLFLIYLKIILYKGEFNKPLVKESILRFPKSIYSSTIKSVHLHSNSVIGLLNCNIKNNTVLIFEPAFYHHECTPGYTKYFLDLGYNVDIILDNFGSNTFCLFKLLENIRIFTFYELSQFSSHSKEFQLIFKNYSNNLKNTLYVNPHYYGDIKIRKKNNRTKFFIISTQKRNYKDLILAAEKLKNENLDFEVIVIGREKTFSIKDLSENIKENFKFKYNTKFKDLYKAVYSSDYIIINLYPNYKNNDLFRKKRLTGSSQLSFGFYKLALIHKSFAEFYNMNSENSFLFDNSNFYGIMREAILLNDEEYKEKQKNLIKLSDSLYKLSLDNIKKSLNSILLK